MSAGTDYGTQPDAIAGLLAAVGDAAVVLSYEEDRTFAALSLSRIGAVASSRLDWTGAEVLESSSVFDGEELRKLLREYGRPEELAVVFWGNLAVPSLALETGLAAAHTDAVLECCYECWIYLVDSRVLIEFQDGEGFTVGRVSG
ncbi:hypothetical protein [Streptomyces sp. NPDC014805]|uniref:hypothetical protein n=1 Tax=Streptomyces sp. NPDC014805 TaxID=3364919 RepID=UPI0036FFDB63